MSAWIEIQPTLGTGWWNYQDRGGGDFAYVKYYKTHDGMVGLTGLLFVEYGYGTNGAVIFTLPVGYRPQNTVIFNQRSDSSVENSRIEIKWDGTVRFASASNSASWVSLAGITFPAEN